METMAWISDSRPESGVWRGGGGVMDRWNGSGDPPPSRWVSGMRRVFLRQRETPKPGNGAVKGCRPWSHTGTRAARSPPVADSEPVFPRPSLSWQL